MPARLGEITGNLATMTLAKLKNVTQIDKHKLDMPWLSTHFRTFTCNQQGSTMLMGKMTTVKGEQYIGIELRTRLHLDNLSGVVQMILSNIKNFRLFLKCPANDKLLNWISEMQIASRMVLASLTHI